MAEVFLYGTNSADAPIEPIEQKLRRIVPDLRRIEKLDEALAAPGGARAVVVFVSAPPTNAQIDEFVTIASRHKERVFFIWITDRIPAEDYKRIVRSGGAEWVSASGSLDEIKEIIGRESRAGASEEAGGPQARVTTFLPCLGGVGNTTIAMEVVLQAKHNKANRSTKICYLDLDLQTSHICDLLDVKPRLQIEEIIEHPERMDGQLLDLFTTRHPSGLDVLAAPPSKLDPCELGFATLDALFDLLLRRYDHIVVDLPVFWFRWTVPILKNSNSVLLTARNSVPCLRQLRATLEAVQNAVGAAENVSVVVNKVRRGLFGKIPNQQHVDRITGRQRAFFVRDDPNALTRANRGLPASLGGAERYAKDFIPIARFCFEREMNRHARTAS